LDWLWSRETMIALAVIGGVLSVLQVVLQKKGRTPPQLLKRLNTAAYGFMLASMVVLIVAGFRASA